MNESEKAILYATEKGYKVIGEDVVSPKGKTLKLQTSGNGYLSFNVRINNQSKRVPVHRFVAYSKYGAALFHKGIMVRHLDGSKTNFSVDNLALGDARDNLMDIPKETRVKNAIHASNSLRKLSDDQVKEARKLREGGMTYSELCGKFKVAKSTMFEVLNRKYVTSV